MKKFFLCVTIISAFCLVSLIIITCTKEYSYEGGAMATYSLVGSPDECINANVNGNYNEGVTLDSSNNVQVQVNVIAAGNYFINTDIVDGISFSASGNFPDSGIYTIVLKANGIPDSAGIYQLQIPGSNGCFFSVEVKGKLMANYILSGTGSDCENPEIKGNYMQYNILGSLNTVTVNVDVFSTGNYTITTDTADGISFSDSGYFFTTGTQQITLKGSGTPDAAGLIYFKVYAGASECVFKIPIQNAEPLATYVLESGFGNPNPCTPQSIDGNYTTGIALSSSNAANISVYVTVPGNFNISTDSLNGMIFKFSGKFTTLGEQTVTLTGSGVPYTSGVFTFDPQIIGPAPLGGNECGFNITVQ